VDEIMNCECGCGQPASIGRRFVVGHNMRGEDLTGRVFGNRKVLGPAPKKTQKENRKWLTICACGKEQVVKGTKLLAGVSKGCPRCNWAKYNHFTYDEWVQIRKVIRSWHI
jgi:hypothetical protein